MADAIITFGSPITIFPYVAYHGVGPNTANILLQIIEVPTSTLEVREFSVVIGYPAEVEIRSKISLSGSVLSFTAVGFSNPFTRPSVIEISRDRQRKFTKLDKQQEIPSSIQNKEEYFISTNLASSENVSPVSESSRQIIYRSILSNVNSKVANKIITNSIVNNYRR